MNEIQIVKAVHSNASKIAALALQTFIESHGHSASEADIKAYVTDKLSVQKIEAELSDQQNLFHLVYMNGELAGYSKIIPETKCEFVPEQGIAKMERLYVLEKFHGMKIGKQLMDFNIQLAKNQQQKGMWLYTWVENQRAIAFYTNIGFQIVGKADFQISKNHSNPNHIMYLKF